MRAGDAKLHDERRFEYNMELEMDTPQQDNKSQVTSRPATTMAVHEDDKTPRGFPEGARVCVTGMKGA